MGRKKKQDDDDKVSLIGRRVEKQFKGFGKFAGAVVSYNAARGFYKVVYDDGDREELEFHEVNQVLVDVVEDVALPGGKRGRQADKLNESCGHGPARKESVSKRQKREPAGRQDTPSSRSNHIEELGRRSQSRPSAQRVRDDNGKEDSFSAEEVKDDDAEEQVEVDVQQSSRHSFKRKRHEEVEESKGRPSPAKSNYQSNPRDRGRGTRGQKLVQNSDDEESTLDGDESSDYEVGSSAEEEEDDLLSSSSSDEDTPSRFHARVSKELKLPAPVPLPPSSRDIALSEDLVAEAFAIYSFLRSFSRVLFLSPFCLDDFVSALIAEAPNSLADSIHLILLQALRRHLQRLSKDGSREAHESLRQRDWNLLDTITWPSFLMVFLATHGFGKFYGQRIASLGLLDVEYYKVSVKTKLAVLGFLCDQVMETEEVRAVLDIRESEFTCQVRQKDKRKIACKVTDTSKEMAKDDALQRTRQTSTSFAVKETRVIQEQNSMDWNSDECVLCGMNGNLICCDGCPAAYHSRCVGISRASLPPGDWFCPECIVEKVGGEQSKCMDGLRGGHLLGIDAFQRTFIATCGHLLVLQSSDFTQSSYKYYSKDDISGVLQSLEMSKPFCDKVAKAIRQHWDMPAKSSSVSNSSQSPLEDLSSLLIPSEGVLRSERHNYDDVENSLVPQITSETICGEQKKAESDPLLPQIITSESDKNPLERVSLEGALVLMPDDVDVKDSLMLPAISESFARQLKETDCVIRCTPPQTVVSESDFRPLEGTLGNTSNVVVCEPDTKPLEGAPGSTSNVAMSDPDTKPLEGAPGTAPKPLEGAPGTTPKPWEGEPGITCKALEGASMITPKPLEGSPGFSSKQLNSQTIEHDPYLAQRVIDRDTKGRFLTAVLREHVHSDQFQKKGLYINHYVLGDVTASAAANLALMTAEQTAPSEKGLKKKTGVTTIAEQLNACYKAPARFYWPSIKKRQMEIPKERCGWCFSCSSSLKRGCLMNQVASHLAAGAARVAGGIRPIKSGSGHLPAVAGYLLYMEDTVHSFLLGPWENLYFRKLWRKKVEQAVSICEVKAALLDLEANLRSVVLSEDWSKCLEDAPSLVLGGSTASYSSESLLRKASSKKSTHRSGMSRKGRFKSRGSALGTVQWGRRGKVARKVSGWAILSSKVARKAGRQGGLKRIMGVTYVEGEEVSKRSKQSAWRARVQAACTVAELAVQVRCFDAQLRWNDLVSKIEVHSATNKSEDNCMTEMANSGIHAKSIKEEVPLYLIDATLISTQGLRQNVSPANQAMKDLIQNSKDQQVWVDERQVPLSLLREFEEKERLSRQSNAPKLVVLQKHHIEVKRITKKDVFKFLWERAGFSTATKLVISLTCKFCSLKVLASMAVQCHLCKEPFHKDCTVPSNLVGGQELKYTCGSCLKLVVGHKPIGFNAVKQQLSACSEVPKNGKAQLALNIVPSRVLEQKKSAFSQPSKSQLSHSLICRSQVKDDSVSLNQQGSQIWARSSVHRNLEKNSISDGVCWRRNGMEPRMRFESKMLFPVEGNKQFSGSPKCFICQQQYRMDLLYIKCEYCPLWFHGVAVGVTESNVSEVVGFKCHRCRKKAVPSCPYGSKHKMNKKGTQVLMSPCSAAMFEVERRRPRVEELYKTKRTPLPLLEAVENQPQHVASPAPCFATKMTSECVTVNPLMETQLLSEGPAQVAVDGIQQCVQASKDDSQISKGDSQTGFREHHEQSEVDCIIQKGPEEVQEFSGGGGMTPVKEIVPGDSFKNGETLSKPVLSFMELLSSEDNRVEELAEFAMYLGVDGLEIFDVDPLTGSFASCETSALGSKEIPSEGDVWQILDEESQSLFQNINAISEEKAISCTVCCDGSVASDLQCVGCGIAAHQQCLAAQSTAGTWTGYGWACDACKAEFLQSQDILTDHMQLIDSRILLQS